MNFDPSLEYEVVWSGREGLTSYLGSSSLQMTMPSAMENGEVLTSKRAPLAPAMVKKIQEHLAGGARDTYIMKALGVSSWDIKKVRGGEVG